jgi:hypothetical protein
MRRLEGEVILKAIGRSGEAHWRVAAEGPASGD